VLDPAAAKGEVKYLEAAAVSVPTIASPTAAFRHAIEHGANGLLADGADAWRDAVLALARDPRRRAALGAEARRDVVERFSAASRARELAAILRALVPHPGRGSGARRRTTPSAVVTSQREPGRARVALEPDLHPVVLREPGSGVTPPLAPGSRLVQPLGEAAGIVRVDVSTVTFGQDECHRIELCVRDQHGRTLVRRRRDAATAPDRAWWSFAWPRGRLRVGASCTLELTVLEAHGAAALSFALAAEPTARDATHGALPAAEGSPAPTGAARARLDGVALAAPLALRTFRPWSA
jgi:hypothetical protein